MNRTRRLFLSTALSSLLGCGGESNSPLFGANPAGSDAAPPSDSAPPSATTTPDQTAPAPNDPSLPSLSGCQSGPIPVHPSLPHFSYLFFCPGSQPYGLNAVDEAYLYSTLGASSIVRVPITGGAPQVLANDPTAGSVVLSGLLLSGNSIFYLVGKSDGSYDLRLIPAAGTAPVVLKTFASSTPVSGLAQDANEIYLTIQTSATKKVGKVVAVHKATAALRELATDVSYPRGMAIDASHVYVEAWGEGVVRIPKQGGTPVTILKNEQIRFGGLALSANSVWALDQGTPPQLDDGKLFVVPKTGGTAVKVADIVSSVAGTMVADGDDVVLFAGAQPTPGDFGTEARPLRVSAQGTVTQIVSPTLFHAGGKISRDNAALYFGSVRMTR